MSEAYLSGTEFRNLMEDLSVKLAEGKADQVRREIAQLIADAKENKSYIDQTYIAEVKKQKRRTKISEIIAMLESMNNEQVDNVHIYVEDEYAEPGHEAAALDLIMKLSKEKQEIGK